MSVDSLDSQEKKDSRKKHLMSRREFLRGGLAVVAGVSLSPLLETVFNTGKAYAVEVKEGMTWEEGLAALKKDVFYTPNEVSAWFTEGRRSLWRAPRDLGIVKGTKKDAEFHHLFAERVASEDGTRAAKYAHTHAFESFVFKGYAPSESREFVARQKEPFLLAPPSLNDVLLHIWTNKRWFEPKRIPLEDLILDPSGMWRMSLQNGLFSDTLFEYFVLIHEKIPQAIERSPLSTEDRKILLGCAKNFDGACVKKYNIAEVTELFNENYGLHIMANELLISADIYMGY